MLKLISLCLAAALLVIPGWPSSSQASADLFVNVSTHFIEVPASAASAEKLFLAATVYQPRFFPSAPAAIYIHGWGGRRLTGSDNLAYYIAAAGYVVVSYTARGFGGGESGGRVSLVGPNEVSDLKHVIDWLVNDPANVIAPRVGKIGVIGGSYGGGHSFQIASDPRVSAVIPLVGWTDLEQALYPNGAINYRLGLAEFYGGLNRSVGTAPFYNYDRLLFEMFDAAASGQVPEGAVKEALRQRSLAERDQSGREVLIASRKPRVPTFIIQSWDDYLFPATQVLDVFSQIDAPKQIYLGRQGHPPGGHEFDGEELYIGTQALRWFDYHLRGIGSLDGDTVSSAPIPFKGRFFNGSSLPSVETDSLALYLKQGGELSRKRKGKHRQESAGGVFRPERIRSSQLGAEIPSREDMFSAKVDPLSGVPRSLVYTHGPLSDDTELLGTSLLDLYVSSDTSESVDVVVRTYDVAPDGTETEVTAGIARIHGLEPGAIRRVTFRDFGDNWVFQRGHSIRVKVSNIDFPDFRPPGANDNQVSQITLHYGKSSPSSIKLPLRRR